MDYTKPFSSLHNAKGKEVVVELKNNLIYKGILEAFDIHLNLVLKSPQETREGSSQNCSDLLIRGDMIVTIKNI